MPWMKVDAARAYAGGISRKALYHAVAAGRLKAARIGAGRSLLFHEAWIDEWLQVTASSPRSDRSAPLEPAADAMGQRRTLRLVRGACFL